MSARPLCEWVSDARYCRNAARVMVRSTSGTMVIPVCKLHANLAKRRGWTIHANYVIGGRVAL